MNISTLVKVNGEDFTAKVLKPFQVKRKKRWGSDMGEVMSGEVKGTFMGIFPEITIIFSPKTEAELSSLINTLDSTNQEIEYYEIGSGQLETIGTYTTDVEYQITSLTSNLPSIAVTFIAEKKVI